MYHPPKRKRAPLEEQRCPDETCEGFGKPLGQGWCEACVASRDPEKRKKGSGPRSLFSFLGTRGSEIESPIAWLIDGCVEIKLIPSSFVEQHDGDPVKVLANWGDYAKRSTQERHLTSGRITDPEFWPTMLRLSKKNLCPASSQVLTDFGSEFFFPGFLCSMSKKFKEVVGIEVDSEVFDKSVELALYLMARAKRERKYISTIELHRGDFLQHDGIIAVMRRTTIAYTNNIIFGSETNVALIDLWRKNLPAKAAMVVFDETAVLASAGDRSSRSHSDIDWAFKRDTIKTSVSWQPPNPCDVYLWEVCREVLPKQNTETFSLLQTPAAKHFLTQIFEAGTKVFVFLEQEVGTVLSFNRQSKQYSVKFTDDQSNFTRIETVLQKDCFKFVSRGRGDKYPACAIPLDASVKCQGLMEDTVWGVVNGVAVDHINHALFYDILSSDYSRFYNQVF
jgi:hypothetical protein